ncbi:MAG: phosphoglucosamine mutase [Geitlerinemataceae cyanobacterium]
MSARETVLDRQLTAIRPAGTPFGQCAIALPETKLFGTDGIRGRVGDVLGAPLALQAGFWAGRVLDPNGQGGTVVIGRDSRNSSSMLAMALSAGLTAAGLEVWDIGLCPTPCVAYLTSAFADAIGGVMISASHNPPPDNGIKFFGADGTKLSPTAQAQIEAGVRGQLDTRATDRWGVHHDRQELAVNYAQSLTQPIADRGLDLSGMTVVLDLAWGAASQVAPHVFRDLGATTICLHDTPDGDRINVNCGSTHLDLLAEAVRDRKADLGFAFDGDADRVLAVDCRGREIDGDYILYLWGQQLRDADRLPDSTIVSTVMANLGFERAWQAQGGTLLRTSVGDRYVHAAMVETGAALGGEQSGHVICRHYGVSGDGTMTALHIAALVRSRGERLSDLIDGSFQTYPQRLENVRVEDRDRRANWQSCESLQRAIDCAAADMGDRGRVLVRASGTEPLIRVMVEAETDSLVNHWTDNLATIVREQLAG